MVNRNPQQPAGGGQPVPTPQNVLDLHNSAKKWSSASCMCSLLVLLLRMQRNFGLGLGLKTQILVACVTLIIYGFAYHKRSKVIVELNRSRGNAPQWMALNARFCMFWFPKMFCCVHPVLDFAVAEYLGNKSKKSISFKTTSTKLLEIKSKAEKCAPKKEFVDDAVSALTCNEGNFEAVKDKSEKLYEMFPEEYFGVKRPTIDQSYEPTVSSDADSSQRTTRDKIKEELKNIFKCMENISDYKSRSKRFSATKEHFQTVVTDLEYFAGIESKVETCRKELFDHDNKDLIYLLEKVKPVLQKIQNRDVNANFKMLENSCGSLKETNFDWTTLATAFGNICRYIKELENAKVVPKGNETFAPLRKMYTPLKELATKAAEIQVLERFALECSETALAYLRSSNTAMKSVIKSQQKIARKVAEKVDTFNGVAVPLLLLAKLNEFRKATGCDVSRKDPLKLWVIYDAVICGCFFACVCVDAKSFSDIWSCRNKTDMNTLCDLYGV